MMTAKKYGHQPTQKLGWTTLAYNKQKGAALDHVPCKRCMQNYEKTKAVWLGSTKGCRVKLLPDAKLHWVHDDSFTVLGITFNMTIDDYAGNTAS